MSGTVTHFEIYGDTPADLAHFYRDVMGWQVEQMPGLNYWRIQVEGGEPATLGGGLTQRAIPGLNGFMLFANVASVDDTASKVVQLGGAIVRPKAAVPRTAWVTIVADPAGNMFGIWEADPKAFPVPHPD